MRVVDLALKDLKQILRDWKAAFFLVAMPIVFTLLFGFIFSDTGAEEDPRLPVGFLDRDDGVLSARFLDLLEDSDAIRPMVLEDEALEDLEEMVDDDEVAGAVVVPAGYSEQNLQLGSEQVSAEEALGLTVVVDEASPAGMTAKSGIQAAAVRLMGAVQTARITAGVLEAQGEAADEALLRETFPKAVEAWADPPLTVEVSQSGTISEDDETGVSSFAHSSPAMMVQFSIAGLIGAAEVLVLERKSKALQRLLTTAISRAGIVLGHFLAMFAMIFLQLALLIGFGQLVLGVDYLRTPLAILLVAVTMALWTAGLGLLIGVLAKTQEQTVVFSMICMFVLSGLGGAWMPLEYTPEAFQTVGHLLPSAWAMDGFENLVIRGLGLSSALFPAGIMLGYAVLFLVLAAWRFRSE